VERERGAARRVRYFQLLELRPAASVVVRDVRMIERLGAPSQLMGSYLRGIEDEGAAPMAYGGEARSPSPRRSQLNK